jgi:ergothioneine biosynthesis protein EgtC
MCRLLGYLGEPIALEKLLYHGENSLVVQSYQPREMTAGLLNADGFGIGWYDAQTEQAPFTYKNTLPIWNDINLPGLSRYIQSGCVLANVRSATPGLAVDLSNCQPFQIGSMQAIHNGFIANFRQTLYRPMRDRLSNLAYQAIQGNTDSEHIIALLLDEQLSDPALCLTDALHRTLETLTILAEKYNTDFSANLILSDGQHLVASRFANRSPMPTLYWLPHHPPFPNAIVIASEPLFPGPWQPLLDRTILTVHHDLTSTHQSI